MVLVAAVLGLFFWLMNITHTVDEKFISPDELKARSAAMPPAPDKVCEKPGDIKFVGQNYAMCCPDGPKSPNCLCRLPNIKSCQQQFSTCLKPDGGIFSKDSRAFLGEENMPTICQKLMEGCVSSSGTQPSSARTPLTGMKPDLSNSADSICSVDRYAQDNLAEFCGQICQQIPGCAYYQTDGLMSGCSLFKGFPVQIEKGAQTNSMGNYQLFSVKATKSESFSDSVSTGLLSQSDAQSFSLKGNGTLSPAGQFCQSGAVDKCSQSAGKSTADCLCTHSVVKDCQKLYQKCLKDSESTQKCRAQFGSCCGLIDSADPLANASMSTDSKQGNGRQTDILCSRPEINSLAACSAACLRLNTCDFINTNLQEIAGDAGSRRQGLTNDGQAPYCQLFKGQPLNTPGVMLGKQIGTGKTIYIKQRGNPNEREINAEFAAQKK